MNLSKIRNNYLLHQLTEEEVGNDPIIFFEKWMLQALESKVLEPTAMALSTVDADLKPSARIILLKGVEDGNFIFYTNYNSRKGKQINNNPSAALLFFWKELERQVRIEGYIKRISTKASDDYFKSRPFESRIGSIVSNQSEVINNREYLETLFKEKIEKYNSTDDIKRPDNWGGYALYPQLIEFWQGRASRLHDRIQFRLKDSVWVKERLAP
ncbi:MAG: pyridoxamine 5'-phosphate oxidase [Omnitrophica WOR_2 bacterium]